MEFDRLYPFPSTSKKLVSILLFYGSTLKNVKLDCSLNVYHKYVYFVYAFYLYLKALVHVLVSVRHRLYLRLSHDLNVKQTVTEAACCIEMRHVLRRIIY